MTDGEIAFVINNAHEMGIKVCLKPVINLSDDLWRARINFPDDDSTYWDEWFESYTNFICHYAQIAEETKCEMFCIGCEMSGTERKTQHWRHVIEKVRGIYTGSVTYNANHGSEEDIEWFDAVDIIGTSAYYAVSKTNEDTEESMIAKWEETKGKLYKVHKKFNKQILFMEIGCRSASGCSTMPWDCFTDLPFDEEEQAKYYSSAMKAYWEEEWFSGFFWWDWKHTLYALEDAKLDKDFSLYGKKAEEVVKEWYKHK